MAAKDFYKVLGLSKNASENDIKKAYHQMAKKYHPDKNKAADAEERFKEIGAAYETLKDPEKKRIYDMQKEGDEEKARMHKQTPPSNFSFNHNSSDNAGGFFGFSANRPRGFTFKSTFTSFDDDDFRRAKEEFENMNPNSSRPKRGKKKKEGKPTGARRRSFNCPRPEWNDNWNEESPRSETPKFGFPSFFMDDPFKEFDKLFEDFFSDIFSASPFGPSFSNIFMPSHHRVHQEHSPFGQSTSNDGEWNDDIFMGGPQRRRQTTPNTRRKQEEEEMYDWSKPVFGFKSYDSDSDSEYFNLEDDHGQILLKCTYCGRRFRPTILRKHEQVCEKWQKRREKTPTSEDEGTSYFDDSPEPKRKDWNKHHDDLLNNEHNARMPKRTNRKPPQMSDPSSTEEDYVECHWCHRQFSEMAARHHIPFCDQKTKHKSDIYPDGRPTSSKTYRAKQYARNVPKPNTSRRSTESMSTDRGKKPPAAPTSDHSAPHATPKAGTGHASRARSHASRAGHGTPRTSRASTSDGNASTAYPGGPSRFAARSHLQNSHSGMGTAGFGRAESPSTSRRPYMDQPFTFTASGLHAYPPRVSTRSRSSVRAELGGRTNQNVNFTMPDIPKVSVRSRSSSAPSVPACSQSGHRNGQIFSMDDLKPRCHRNIHIPTAAI